MAEQKKKEIINYQINSKKVKSIADIRRLLDVFQFTFSSSREPDGDLKYLIDKEIIVEVDDSK